VRTDEIAWAAGLFEGEGSVFVHTGKPGTGKQPRRNYSITLTVALTTTDHDVILRFREAIGVGRINSEPRPRRDRPGHHKLAYLWRAYSADAATVLDLFWPYLGERRQEQAMRALERAGLARQHRGIVDAA
jgi:hypothetical protein